MNELLSKSVPLAAVVYVVRFDGKGRALKEVAFHIEASGATHVDGNAPGALEALLAATRCSMKVTIGQDMLTAIRERNARDLIGPGAEGEGTLNAEGSTLNIEWPERLPAAGEVF